jgi:hypothetical protein
MSNRHRKRINEPDGGDEGEDEELKRINGDKQESQNRRRQQKQQQQQRSANYDDEYEDSPSPPFPYPVDPIDKTSPVDLEPPQAGEATTSKWQAVRDEIENNESKKLNSEPETAWDSMVRAIKSTPKNAKNFLGVESPSLNNPVKNKTLNNWQERTFRVLNDNMIFGGKLKEKVLDRYISNLDENMVDESDPFMFFKITGERIISHRPDVARMAYQRVRKAIGIKKPSRDAAAELAQLEPGRDFEELESSSNQQQPPQSRMLMSKMTPQPTDFGDGRRLQGRRQMTHEEEEEENIEGPCDAFTHAFTGKRKFGVGFCGRLCDNFLDPDKQEKYEGLLKSVKQHRPYFTYWLV